MRLWVPPSVRQNVQIDLMAAVLFGVFGGLTVPFVPVMGRRLGASPLEVSVLVAAPAVAVVLSLWWVNVVQRLPAMRLVVWTQVGGRALLLFTPFIHTPAPYVGLILAYHATASIGAMGYAEVLRAAYPREARARIMGLVRVWMAVVWVGASALGGYIVQYVPFQWVFAAAALFGMASTLVFSRIRISDTPPQQERIGLAGSRRILREDRAFRRFLGAFFVFGFGAWLMGPVVPLLLVDVLHATNVQVGLLGATTSATWIAAYYVWGRVMDRRPPSSSIALVFAIGAVTPAIFLVAATPWMALPAGATDGLTSAGIDLGWLNGVLQYAPAGQVRQYVAIFNTLIGVRGVIAPLLTGLLIPVVGLKVILAAAGLFMLSGAAVIATPAAWRRRARGRGSAR